MLQLLFFKAYFFSLFNELTILAGIPTTVTYAGMFFKTIEPAPILEPIPTSIFPKTFAPDPITTPFRIVGCLSFPRLLPVLPKVTE